jgi:SAM-dependent methyltransferase
MTKPPRGPKPQALEAGRPGAQTVDAPEDAEGLSGAFDRYSAHVEEVLRSGDASSIKRIYHEYGELLEAVARTGEPVPVLSRPETLVAVTGILKGVRGRVLDAGCGANPVASIALSSPVRAMVGADIALGTVRLAGAAAAARGTRFFGVVADLEALPFRSSAFDGAICDDTIEHLPRDDVGAAELARVLRSGGRLALATPNRHSAEVLYRKAQDLIRRRRRPASAYYAAASHLREYSWRELEHLVRPRFLVRGRAPVGWSGGSKRRVATSIIGLPVLRRLSRMVVVELEPRRPPS